MEITPLTSETFDTLWTDAKHSPDNASPLLKALYKDPISSKDDFDAILGSLEEIETNDPQRSLAARVCKGFLYANDTVRNEQEILIYEENGEAKYTKVLPDQGRNWLLTIPAQETVDASKTSALTWKLLELTQKFLTFDTLTQSPAGT